MKHGLFRKGLCKLRHGGARVPRAAFVLCTAAALCGCTGFEPTHVQGDSGWVTQPGAQISLNLTRDRQHPASEPHTGYALEAGYQHMKSGSDQTLTAGQQPVVLGGLTFAPPAQLRNTFDFTYVAAGLRRRAFFPGTPLGLEWNLGLSGSNLDVSVASPTQQAARSYGGGMLHLGLGAIVRINPASSVHLHAIDDISFSTAVQEWEVYYAWAPHDNLSLQLGYANWSVQALSDGPDSKVDLNIAGPMIRLQASFNGESHPAHPGHPGMEPGEQGHFSGSGWPLAQPARSEETAPAIMPEPAASAVPATAPAAPQDGVP